MLPGYYAIIRHSLSHNIFKSSICHPIVRACHTQGSNIQLPKRIEDARRSRNPIGGIVNLSRAFHDYRQYSRSHLSSNNPTIVTTTELKDRITLFRAGEEDSQSIPSFDDLRPSLEGIVQQMKSSGGDRKSPFVWLDITNPSTNEIKEVSHAFGLHRLTVEDVVEAEMREKMEEYDNVSMYLMEIE